MKTRATGSPRASLAPLRDFAYRTNDLPKVLDMARRGFEEWHTPD